MKVKTQRKRSAYPFWTPKKNTPSKGKKRHFPADCLTTVTVIWNIMCVDAPESTTNSRSSGLRVDAGRHLFSEREKNAALWCSFNFNTLLGQLPRCFADTLLLPLCLFLWTILKIRSVGATLMKFTWTNVTEREILVSNFGMTCNSLCEFQTLDWFRYVGALPENRLRRRHVLKYATQLPCIRKSTFRWLFSQLFITPLIRFPRSIVTLVGDRILFLANFPCSTIATALLPLFFLDLFVGCSSTWRCAKKHFSPNRQPLLVL